MIINEGVKVRIGADTSQLEKSLKGSKANVAAWGAAAAAAFAAVAVQSAKMAAQLDRDLRLVSTLGGEAAGNVGQLRTEIKQLGTEFGRDFRQLASANYQAVSGGFKSIAESMELTRAGTRLSVAGNADLVGSTEAVVKALNAFDMSAADADKAAAQLWGITRDGIITVEQLGKFLADLPVAAAQSGIEFEEMAAAISTLTASGVPASTAMEQLRSAIIQFEKRGITGSLVERTRQFAGQGIGELTRQLGNETAARGVLVLASNLTKFEANVSAASNVTGDYNDAVDTMASGALAEWEQLQQKVNGLMQSLGSTLLEVVTPAIMGMNQALEGTPEDKLIRVIGAGERLAVGPNAATRAASSGGFDALFSSPNPLLGTWAGGRNPLPVRPAQEQFFNDYGLDPRMTGGGFMAANGFGLPPLVSSNRQYGGTAAAQMSDPTSDFIGGELGEYDFGTIDKELLGIEQSSRLAASSAGILSGSLGGLLTSALGTADSAVGRFVGGLLSQFAQLGIRSVIGGAFGLPGFASGGYTGATGGVVHAGEYVMPQSVVQSMGLGRLERMHAVAGAGSTANTLNVTVNANSGDASQIAQVTADEVGRAMRQLQSTGKSRLYRPAMNRFRG